MVGTTLEREAYRKRVGSTQSVRGLIEWTLSENPDLRTRDLTTDIMNYDEMSGTAEKVSDQLSQLEGTTKVPAEAGKQDPSKLNVRPATRRTRPQGLPEKGDLSEFSSRKGT
ncbi:hypothetical protein NDN08_007442 [Rhodosorus marinus]|uniref:Uncharacterized protein n=1 Tax=Rhodosorus marinus TaxID=101924 RepID=A0AAV8V1N5_9RHOD|nr:hypothetical protein NDN08_007442 [Rhodosorus marinus]